MDAVKIGLAVQSGVSIVCATCKRYWEGRERGLPDPKCTVTEPCGSPFAGLAFPQYDGPMTDFKRWCFVCGVEATKALRGGSSGLAIGICEKHLKMVGNIEPVGLNGHPVLHIIATPDGDRTPQQLLGAPKQTLGRAIAEAEEHFQGKGGR